MIDVRELAPGDRPAAARLFADAFVDDPGWTDVGPGGRRRRWQFTRRVCAGELRAAERAGGTVLATFDDSAPSATIVWFPSTDIVAPWRLMAAQAPGAILGGPGVLRRSLAADAALGGGHPAEPHLYVSLLAAHPERQRGGRGRALLEAAVAEAERREIPAYLDTANPANLPYYHQFGFAITGEARLPRGAPLWYLLRAR